MKFFYIIKSLPLSLYIQNLNKPLTHQFFMVLLQVTPDDPRQIIKIFHLKFKRDKYSGIINKQTNFVICRHV